MRPVFALDRILPTVSALPDMGWDLEWVSTLLPDGVGNIERHQRQDTGDGGLVDGIWGPACRSGRACFHHIGLLTPPCQNMSIALVRLRTPCFHRGFLAAEMSAHKQTRIVVSDCLLYCFCGH